MLKMGIIDSSVRLSPRDEMCPDWDTLSDEDKDMWDLRMAVYGDMIDRMDRNIGRIVNYLTESGEIDNTLIIFLADNGGCHEPIKNRGNYLPTKAETGTRESFDAYEYPWANASNTPFRMFKHWVHEGGIASPFIESFLKVIKGDQITDQPGHIIDIMPTLLDFAGGKYPDYLNGSVIQPMEGISLMPALTGEKLKRENPLFWEHEGKRAMRSGDWKLVSAYDYGTKKFKSWELYDLESDRSELIDLSNKYPEIMEKMIEEYELWVVRAGVIPKEIIDRR